MLSFWGFLILLFLICFFRHFAILISVDYQHVMGNQQDFNNKMMDCEHKKRRRGNCSLPVPRTEALALPNPAEQTTLEPTPICILAKHHVWPYSLLYQNRYIASMGCSNIVTPNGHLPLAMLKTEF